MNDQSVRDNYWMRYALALAAKAELAGEIPVGAVVVLNDELVAEGWNQPISTNDPSAHAEIIALRNAAQKLTNYRLLNTSLYVTLEPCVMCAGALVQARIRRLVFGASDAKAGAIHSVFNVLDNKRLNHHVEWRGDCLAKECSEVLSVFFHKRR